MLGLILRSCIRDDVLSIVLAYMYCTMTTFYDTTPQYGLLFGWVFCLFVYSLFACLTFFDFSSFFFKAKGVLNGTAFKSL